MSDSVPAVSLAEWRTALRDVVGHYVHAETRPAAGTPVPIGSPFPKQAFHVTDPQQTWRRKSVGALPVVLDEPPAGASTVDEFHTVPVSMARAAYPLQARHAISSARHRLATAVVAREPKEAHGVVSFRVTLVLTPLPEAEAVGTPVPSDAEVAAMFGVKDKK